MFEYFLLNIVTDSNQNCVRSPIKTADLIDNFSSRGNSGRNGFISALQCQMLAVCKYTAHSSVCHY